MSTEPTSTTSAAASPATATAAASVFSPLEKKPTTAAGTTATTTSMTSASVRASFPPLDPDREPEQTASSWYQWLLYSWVSPLLERGTALHEADLPLEEQDLMKLPRHEDPSLNYAQIKDLWEEELVQFKKRKEEKKKAKQREQQHATKQNADDEEMKNKEDKKKDEEDDENNTEDDEDKPSIVPILWRVFRPLILLGGLLRFIADGCAFAVPFLLKEFSTWLVAPGSGDNLGEGFGWLFGMVLAQVAAQQFMNAANHHTQTAFHQMRGALRLLVFDAALTYPSSHEETGKVISAHSSDTGNLTDLALMLHSAWISPLMIIASVIALWGFIGYAGIIVFGMQLALLPVQMAITTKLFAMRPAMQKAGAARAQTLSEMVNGIRIVKFMCWESAMAARLQSRRDAELELYGTLQRWRAVIVVLASVVPSIMNMSCFMIAYALDGQLQLGAVFPALTVLNAMRMPMLMLPLAVGKLLDTSVAVSRISEVCAAVNDRYEYVERVHEKKQNNDDKNNNNDDDGDDSKNGNSANSNSHPNAMEMSNITVLATKSTMASRMAGMDKAAIMKMKMMQQMQQQAAAAAGGGRDKKKSKKKQKPQVLAKNLTVNIPRGKLTIVCGATASGKSVLVQTLIGESEIDQQQHKDKSAQSYLKHYTATAYAPQEAWILNCSLRDNIVMAEPFDQDKYDRVCALCQLTPDFAALPAGDLTEIGEKGINVSGGQKARISLARAVYSGRETVLMDDPLSAVDPHVSAALFDECICGDGALAGKTRVLVTHQVQLIPRADFVIMMEGCKIKFAGSVEEMRAAGLLAEVEKLSQKEQEEKERKKQEKLKQLQQQAGGSPSSPAAAAGSPTTTAAAAAAEGAAAAAEGAAVAALVAKNNDAATSPTKTMLPLASPIAPGTGATGASGASPLRAVVGSPSSSSPAGALITKEIDEAGVVTWSTYAWYFFDIGSSCAMFSVVFFALLSSVAGIFTQLSLAAWTTPVIPANLTSGKAASSSSGSLSDNYVGFSAETYMIGIGIFLAIQLVCTLISKFSFVSFFLAVAHNAHHLLADSILRAPTYFFDTTPTGRILVRFTRDISGCDFMLFEALSHVQTMFFAVLVHTVTVCVSAPYILVLLPLMIIFFRYVYVVYSNTVRGLKRLDGSAQSPVVAILNEVVGGLASIRAFGIGAMLAARHEKRALLAATPMSNLRACQRWLLARTDLAGVCLLFFASLFGVVSRVGDQSSWLPVAPSLTALAISSAFVATNTISQLTRAFGELETNFTAVERVKQYVDDLPREPTYEYAAITYNSNSNSNPDNSGGDNNDNSKPLPPPGPSWPASNPSVEFSHVSMRYRPNLPLVLKDVSFVIPPRSRLAVVGKTGSGKSSALQTIFRMVEIEKDGVGKILIGGRDIYKTKIQDLRKAITMIPQDPTLFAGTIKTNLDPFNERSDDELWDVLDKLKLRERLTTFITDKDEPKGLQAQVREKGSNFSLGERQLLCLARALMKRSSILMLDEPTASVDNASDALIQRIIREEFKDCLQITIAHRLGTIIDSDLVLVMRDGSVAEFDTPKNLLANSATLFHSMVSKLGPEQFKLLKAVADGERSYADALGVVEN